MPELNEWKSAVGDDSSFGGKVLGMDRSLWIIHREARRRAGLASLARAGDGVWLASPSDDLPSSAAPPEVVVLGLADDFEMELEFAHRASKLLSNCAWILVPESDAADEARRLFDSLHAELIAFPPEPLALRRAIRTARARRSADPLSVRRSRDELVSRFTRWFADLELPELLRAMDPRVQRAQLLIRGEPGTGRALLARYVHAFGERRAARDRGAFLQLSCRGIERSNDLLDAVRDAAPRQAGRVWSVWLEDVDALPMPVQHNLQRWVEFGLPEGVAQCRRLRWISGASDDENPSPGREFDVGLQRALAGLTLRIPPLRERESAIEAFAADTALAWSTLHGERTRLLSEDCMRALRAYPWPGNLAELEAVVKQTLSASAADPIRADHLRFDASGAVVETVEHAGDDEDGLDEPIELVPLDEDGFSEKSSEGKAVDIATLLEDLLDEQRAEIRARNLLVLRELDRSRPFAVGIEDQLERAFRETLTTALERVPDRGDVYIASRHSASGSAGDPTVRVLIRYRGSERSPVGAERSGGGALHGDAVELSRARDIIREQGGRLTVDSGDARETVIVVDLPAPR